MHIIFLISETYGHTGHNAAKEREYLGCSRSTFQCAVFVLLQNGSAKQRKLSFTHGWVIG